MRIVLDANVVVAAFASRGLCESILEVCLHSHQIVFCVDLIDEIVRNLHRKVQLPEEIVERIGRFLREQAILADPVALEPGTCRDPDDVKILGLATAVKADFIVTGDQDLLTLERFNSIPIVSPRTFSTLLAERIE